MLADPFYLFIISFTLIRQKDIYFCMDRVALNNERSMTNHDVKEKLNIMLNFIAASGCTKAFVLNIDSTTYMELCAEPYIVHREVCLQRTLMAKSTSCCRQHSTLPPKRKPAASNHQ